jgi:hypothetical protein
VFSGQQRINLVVNYSNKFGKFPSVKLKPMDKPWIRKEITREVRKYFELKENEPGTYQNVWIKVLRNIQHQMHKLEKIVAELKQSPGLPRLSMIQYCLQVQG